MRPTKSKHLNLYILLRVRLFLRFLAYFFVWMGGISGFGAREAKGQSGTGYLPDYARYVIVIDNTFSMRRYHENVEKALLHWLDTGWGGRASGGDGVSIWTYSKYGGSALLETKTWRIRAQQKLLDQSLIAMGEIRYFGRPKAQEILSLLNSNVASGVPLTVLWITDGKSDFYGTPFDSEILKIFKTQQEFIKKARIPFVLTLESKAGKWEAWGVNRLTLESPPFLLPPSPAFENTAPPPSSSTNNDDYEVPFEAEEKKSAEAEATQNAANQPIREKEMIQAQEDAEDHGQKMETESYASPTIVTSGDSNPLGRLAKKINGIQHIDSETDSKSNVSEDNEDPPETDLPSPRTEVQANANEGTRAIPNMLPEAASSPPADSQEKSANKKSSEKLSPDEPVRMSKKILTESNPKETVGLSNKNPLRYFGLSFLFLALAIGLAWTARQILFPKTEKNSAINSSAYLKNQRQVAKNGRGSLISSTQATKTKDRKSISAKASKARKKI